MDYLAQQDYDPEGHFDSSSSGSSAGDHSSPSAFSAHSTQDWALDLGLAVPWSPSHNPLDPVSFAHGVKLAPRSRGSTPGVGGPRSPSAGRNGASPAPQPTAAARDGSFDLTGDFWSAAPGGASDPSALSPKDGGVGQRDFALPEGGRRTGHEQESSMDFEDMVHEGVCGPSTFNHPSTSSLPCSSSSATPTAMAYAASNAFLPPHTHHAHSQTPSHFSSALPALPVDPSTLHGGIAPSLMNGHLSTTTPLNSPGTEHAPNPFAMSTRSVSASASASARTSLDGAEDDSMDVSATSYAPSRASSRSSSRPRTAREPSLAAAYAHPAVAAPAATPASSSAAAAAAAAKAPVYNAKGTLNLVAREAIQASELIPTLSYPSPSDLALSPSPSSSSSPTPPLQLLILGVPLTGAKSRVETQIKVSLALVRPQAGAARAPLGPGEEGYLVEDGGLSARAAGELERIGSWSHVRLPKYLALKAKSKAASAKKAQKPEPTPESTLTLDVAVVSATDPSQQIFICTNCQQRELKRSLRKKDPKGKTFTAPVPPPDPSAPPRNEDEELRKVVVFNAAEFVEFASGECVIPTRVTCYCRHHKEKKGFRVTYCLRDHLGNVVANGASPPIMITDDHKTTTSTKPAPSASEAALAALAGIPAAASPSTASNSKRKAPAKPAKEPKARKEKAPSPSASATSASGRPRRTTAGRSRRGQTDSDDEGETASKKARPYDAEARPSRKRPTNQHRSPTFAMTPLNSAPATAAASPTASMVSLPPLPDGAQTPSAAASPMSSYGTALGLGGMGDAVMASGDGMASGLATPSSLSHRNGSVDLGQNGFDFRSAMSTPPLSPGSNAPSVADTFHSLFSGFPSPNPSVLEPTAAPPPAPHQLQPQPGTVPSFLIPATEPLSTSLTPDWALLQQQLQQSAPPAPPPRITRIIPGEGPVHGGIEVTVLGENFVQGLVCVFGDSPAVPTHFWSASTLVCNLPPSANPGPVVVGIKGVPLTVDQGTGLQLFTYKDDSDRSLLELALQVVGLKMTGKLENASAIAMRIVGNSPNGGGAGAGGAGGAPLGGAPTDTATLAATLNAAATSVYATPATSRASSRRSSLTGTGSPTSSTVALPADIAATGPRNFEGIVINFLSLLDLDPSLIPGAAPSLPSSLPPISHANAQHHTLLHLATVLGFHRLVAFLLARDIALDAPDSNGFTALHFAALYGRVAIARLLLDAGARVAVRNLAGKTPLDIAHERDDVDVEELLLARGAASATPTVPMQRRALAAPPVWGRRPSVGELYEDEYSDAESSEGAWSETPSQADYSSEWDESESGSELESASASEQSEWDSETASEWDESGEEADVEATPALERRARSRFSSRNASTISLHYLLEAEEEARAGRVSPKSRKAQLPAQDDIRTAPPLAAPTPITPLNHLASASSAWLSQKFGPTVQPSLNKLQPFTGGVTRTWEKATSGFTLPQMHMPEIAAFHAMPAALTRRLSVSRTRSARHGGANVDDTAIEETDLDDGDKSASERSTASAFARDWRASLVSPGQWWHSHKAPSSPPPQYTPTDGLATPFEKEKIPIASTSTAAPFKRSTSSPSPPSSPSVSSARSSPVPVRTRPRRRTSTTSYTSEDTDSEAFLGEQGKLVGFSGDRMLLLFWLPVLLFVLAFAYANWNQYAQPVVDTLADTILPASISRLLR
ncbi:hypothetical protein JCM10207_005052 [Rhodosporidiobolus poonsookiae]